MSANNLQPYAPDLKALMPVLRIPDGELMNTETGQFTNGGICYGDVFNFASKCMRAAIAGANAHYEAQVCQLVTIERSKYAAEREQWRAALKYAITEAEMWLDECHGEKSIETSEMVSAKALLLSITVHTSGEAS